MLKIRHISITAPISINEHISLPNFLMLSKKKHVFFLDQYFYDYSGYPDIFVWTKFLL